MSEAHKGKKLSEEHKRKIGESCKGHKPGIKTEEGLMRLRLANLGKVMSDETKEKISKTLTGIKRSPETLQKRKEHNPLCVKVYCPELDIVFQTIADAAKYAETHRSNIQKCLRGERKSAGRNKLTNEKLHWKYVEE